MLIFPDGCRYPITDWKLSSILDESLTVGSECPEFDGYTYCIAVLRLPNMLTSEPPLSSNAVMFVYGYAFHGDADSNKKHQKVLFCEFSLAETLVSPWPGIDLTQADDLLVLADRMDEWEYGAGAAARKAAKALQELPMQIDAD